MTERGAVLGFEFGPKKFIHKVTVNVLLQTLPSIHFFQTTAASSSPQHRQ